METHLSKAQRGNALFLILIAVALFAALSYAITQSSRGGGDTSKETDIILAAQIVQMGADLRASAQRLILRNGVSPLNIRYHLEADVFSPCTVTDGTCLFTPEGGGAAFPVVGQNIAAAAYDPAFLGNPLNVIFIEPDEKNRSTGIPATRIVGVGSPAADGGVGFMGIKKSVCEAINKGLGIDTMPVIVVADLTATLPDFQTIDLNDHTSGCLDMGDAVPGVYEYYQLITEN